MISLNELSTKIIRKLDPKTRSVNSPSVIFEPNEILKLYNDNNNKKGIKLDKKDLVDDDVINWFKAHVEHLMWHDIRVTGHQVILTAHVRLEN